MTVSEAISLVDRLRPNQFPETIKISWLSKLDGQIFEEIIQTHEGGAADRFTGYGESSQD